MRKRPLPRLAFPKWALRGEGTLLAYNLYLNNYTAFFRFCQEYLGNRWRAAKKFRQNAETFALFMRFFLFLPAKDGAGARTRRPSPLRTSVPMRLATLPGRAGGPSPAAQKTGGVFCPETRGLPRPRYSASASSNQSAAEASEGIRQSPRGERATEPTLTPSGRQERLNCCEKKRL